MRAGKITEGMGLAASLQMSDGAPLFSLGLDLLHKDGATLDHAGLAQAFRQDLLPKDGQDGLRGFGHLPGGTLHTLSAVGVAASLLVHLHAATHVHVHVRGPAGHVLEMTKHHSLLVAPRSSMLLRGQPQAQPQAHQAELCQGVQPDVEDLHGEHGTPWAKRGVDVQMGGLQHSPLQLMACAPRSRSFSWALHAAKQHHQVSLCGPWVAGHEDWAHAP